MAAADYRLMTEATGQRIAAALEALHLATVTGVKGDAEQNYRHGDVNLTPASIGAFSTSAVIDILHGGTGATTPAGARANLQAENTIVTNYSISDFTTVFLQPFDGRLRAVKKGSMVYLFYAAYMGYLANTVVDLFILPPALRPIINQLGVPITITDGNITVIGYGYADIKDNGAVQMNVNAVGYVQLCVTYIAGN